jgi:hypothetical protein
MDEFGKPAKEVAGAKGRIRVTGRLRVAENGSLIVEADQVEAVAKKK